MVTVEKRQDEPCLQEFTTWSQCTACNKQVSPQRALSNHSLRYSFGKFLEVRTCSCSPDLCSCSRCTARRSSWHGIVEHHHRKGALANAKRSSSWRKTHSLNGTH